MRVVFFKQKTAYWMRISDWSSDVCSSGLADTDPDTDRHRDLAERETPRGKTDQAARKAEHGDDLAARTFEEVGELLQRGIEGGVGTGKGGTGAGQGHAGGKNVVAATSTVGRALQGRKGSLGGHGRSEEHTSELQTLMRIS